MTEKEELVEIVLGLKAELAELKEAISKNSKTKHCEDSFNEAAFQRKAMIDEAKYWIRKVKSGQLKAREVDSLYILERILDKGQALKKEESNDEPK